MARERWFYVESGQRMGPFSLQQLVESLLALPDPLGRLVWHRGLPAWTRASEVPQVADRLAPFVAERAPTPPATPALTDREAELAATPTQPAAAVPAYSKAAALLRQPQGYLAAAAVCLLLAIGVWGLWFRASDAEGPGAHLGTEPDAESGTASGARSPGPGPGPSAAGPAARRTRRSDPKRPRASRAGKKRSRRCRSRSSRSCAASRAGAARG